MESGLPRLSSPLLCPHFSYAHEILSPSPQARSHHANHSTPQASVLLGSEEDDPAGITRRLCWDTATVLSAVEEAVLSGREAFLPDLALVRPAEQMLWLLEPDILQGASNGPSWEETAL